MTRFASVALLVTAALLPIAPSAGAAQCGSEPAGGGEALQGTLQLDATSSATSLDFGRSSKKKSAVLVFDVTGCTLDSAEGLLAKAHASEGQAAFGTPEIEAEGNQLTVEFPVERGEFGAGSHTAAVTVHGPSIATATAAVSYQRSEDYFWPIVLAVLGGVAGFLAAVFTKKKQADDKEKARLKGYRLAVAFVVGGIGAGAVWLASYGEAPIWQATPVAVVALVAGAASAAYGAAGGALLGESTK